MKAVSLKLFEFSEKNSAQREHEII